MALHGIPSLGNLTVGKPPPARTTLGDAKRPEAAPMRFHGSEAQRPRAILFTRFDALQKAASKH